MKIDSLGIKTYRSCDNCPDTNLTTTRIFDSPAILSELLKIGAQFMTLNLSEDNIVQIAKGVTFMALFE